MDTLLRDIARLLEAGEPFSVGTVIHTSGSTPQKTGARAIFLPGGDLLGTLGGGCMEAEARRRGLQLLLGGEPELMELHLDDDFGWDDGLICGGTAHIFLQPRPEPDQGEVFTAAVALREAQGRGMFALVAAGPAEAVGRSILCVDGAPAVGDLRHGALQQAVEAATADLLAEGVDESRRVRLKDLEATVFLEPLLPRPVCFIAGAGHIGAALCHYAARVGFDVAVVDDRPSLCNRERMPDATHIIAGDIVQTVRDWPKTPNTYFVIVTRGHKNDAVVLREVVKAPVRYVGMVGSKRKILTIYQEFLDQGLATPEELARIHAPLGLDIGARSVDEIALCIAAELVMVRRKEARDVTTPRYSDCAGGGRVAPDGGAEAALAVRLGDRAAVGRPLAESLPRRPGRGGAGAPE
jgi:xanthine dehydrogenase accessory factor